MTKKKEIAPKIKKDDISNQELIWMMIGVFLVAFLGMLHITKNTSLRIVGDEFGYWTAGATFVGIDWSSVAYYNMYYAYGYGAVLAPILLLNVSQVLKYQIAIGINVTMLAGVFLLIFRAIVKTDKRPAHAAFISLACTLYTGNIVYSQFTLAETFILLLYVLSVTAFIAFLQKGKLIHAILLPVISGILLTAHMRTIALVPVLVLFFVVYTLKKKNYRALAAFCVTGILVSISVYLLTKWYQDAVPVFDEKNQVSGRVGGLMSVFTPEGFSKTFISFLGKVTYTTLASFGIAMIASIRIIRNTISEWKSGELRLITILGLFLLLSLLAMEAISAISTKNYTNRYDNLTYGRYHDFTICVLLAYELYLGLIKREKIYLFELILTGVFAVLLTVIIQNSLPVFKNTGHLSVFSSGVFRFIKNKNDLFYLTLIGFLVSVLYYLFNTNLIPRGKKWNYHTGALSFLLSGLFLFMSFTALDDVLYWGVPQCTREEKLARQILRDSTIDRVLYYVPDHNLMIDNMQFLLNDKSVQCFSDESYLLEVGPNDCLLTAASSKLISGERKEEFELQGASTCLKYWRKKK